MAESHSRPGTPPAPTPATLGQRAAGAASWRYASLVLQGGLQFAVGVLLARLLPPEDFGVVALAYVAIGFATMFAELGLGPAVVQRHPLTPAHIRVSFTAALIAGFAMGLLLVTLAPLFSAVARQDELTGVLRASALLFVFAGFGTTARALLQRALAFKRLFLIEALSFALGYAGVAITLALLGYGVWSLVLGALVQSLLGCVLALAATRHPARPLLARRELRDLLGSGMGFTLNSVVNYVARNADHLIIGRWLGAQALGLYSRAFKLMQLPLADVGAVVYSVLFPAFAEIQRDVARVRRVYLLGVQCTALVSIPTMVGMFVAAPHLIHGLYGPNWSGAVAPLQILCAAGLFRTIYYLSCSVAQASGHVYGEARRQMVFTGLAIGGALIGVGHGVAGVAIGILCASIAMYLMMTQLVIRLIRCTWGEFFLAQLPGAVLGAMVGAAAMAARLTMEQQGAASLLTLLAVIAASAAALPVGVYWLPARLRPIDLFARFGTGIPRLPMALRPFATELLRLPHPGVSR